MKWLRVLYSFMISICFWQQIPHPCKLLARFIKILMLSLEMFVFWMYSYIKEGILIFMRAFISLLAMTLSLIWSIFRSESLYPSDLSPRDRESGKVHETNCNTLIFQIVRQSALKTLILISLYQKLKLWINSWAWCASRMLRM